MMGLIATTMNFLVKMSPLIFIFHGEKETSKSGIKWINEYCSLNRYMGPCVHILRMVYSEEMWQWFGNQCEIYFQDGLDCIAR